MESRLDQFSKILAADLPRRQVLKRLGGLVGGALLGLFAFGKKAAAKGIDPCITACRPVQNIAACFAYCVTACRKLAGVGFVVCPCGFCPLGTICRSGACVRRCLANGAKCTKNSQCCTGCCANPGYAASSTCHPKAACIM